MLLFLQFYSVSVDLPLTLTTNRPDNAIPVFMDIDGWFYSSNGSLIEVDYDRQKDSFLLTGNREHIVFDLLPEPFNGLRGDFDDGITRELDKSGRWNVGYFIQEFNSDSSYIPSQTLGNPRGMTSTLSLESLTPGM